MRRADERLRDNTRLDGGSHLAMHHGVRVADIFTGCFLNPTFSDTRAPPAEPPTKCFMWKGARGIRGHSRRVFKALDRVP